jgi:hypothetical protein
MEIGMLHLMDKFANQFVIEIPSKDQQKKKKKKVCNRDDSLIPSVKDDCFVDVHILGTLPF